MDVSIGFLLTFFSVAETAVKWKPDMKSFSHSVKQGGCNANQEISLFEYTAGPGVITEQWFTGKGCIDETTIVRYYVDGDKTPSIEANLYLVHGMAFPAKGKEIRSYESQSQGEYEEPKTTNQKLMSLKKDQLEKSLMKNQTLSDKHSRSLDDTLDENEFLIKSFNQMKTQFTNSWKEKGSRRTETYLGSENYRNQKENPLRNLFTNTGDWSREQNYVAKGEVSPDDNLVPNDDTDSQADSRTEPNTDDPDPAVPWGTHRMGHLAKNGALYNTIRIPFQKSIYVSLISTRHGHYWYNIRGVKNYPVIIGDLELPQNTRLKVYKKENITVMPFEYIFLASSFNTSGLLYLVTFSTKSKNFFHQEACFRAIVDNDENIQYLSSGTEDLFLSAYYYNAGIYHTDHAGLSYKDPAGGVTAYKFFEHDPVLFSNAFSLAWRCGEQADNKCFKIHQKDCSRKYGKNDCLTKDDYDAIQDFNDSNKKHTKPTTITSYIWIYEW